MTDPTWQQRAAKRAVFDKVKVTFSDTHPVHRKNVDEAIAFAFAKLQAEHPALRLHLPKPTTLPPSPNKPNGKYIYELFGFTAELVRYLPWEWAEFVRYVDVKIFVETPNHDQDTTLQQVFETPGGKRNMFIGYRRRGNRSGTKAPGKVYTLGSGKSGIHLNCYKRPGQPTGIEGKFRDEMVTKVVAAVSDLKAMHGWPDADCWVIARTSWGNRAAQEWGAELRGRGYEPQEVFEPVTYDEWRSREEKSASETTDNVQASPSAGDSADSK